MLEGLVRIAANGGGMILDGSKLQPDDLSRIASNAAGKGCRITVRNTRGFQLDDLVRVASNGRGAVTFDFSDE